MMVTTNFKFSKHSLSFPCILQYTIPYGTLTKETLSNRFSISLLKVSDASEF